MFTVLQYNDLSVMCTVCFAKDKQYFESYGQKWFYVPEAHIMYFIWPWKSREKSLDFQGPPLTNTPRNGSCPPQNH